MICKHCGAKIEENTKFCSNCGFQLENKNEQIDTENVNQNDLSTPENNIQNYFYETGQQSNNNARETVNSLLPHVKKKKPIYKRVWFIVLIAFIVLVIIGALFRGEKTEEIVWSNLILGSMLPETPTDKGIIHENSSDELSLEVQKLSIKQYSNYVTSCRNKGFIVDEEQKSSSFEAYNKEGYKLELDYYENGGKIFINVNIPIKMSTIQWPTSKIGKLLPEPKSKQGKFSYEHDTSFDVYIGNTSLNDYNSYVTEVSESGFNLNYDKEEKRYSADNSEGYSVIIEYEGFNTMHISIDSPSEDDSLDDETTAKVTETKTTTKKATNKETTKRATLGEINALEKAEDYLNMGGFSKKSLKDQLDFEGFTKDEIDYAIKNCSADWKKQCVIKANAYLDMGGFSRQSLKDQLEFEGFTDSQIEYALTEVGY